MELLGVDIQTIYLYGLIIGGTITLLYMLFGDVFEVIGAVVDVAPGSLLNPTVILSFVSVLCGAGYIFELRGTFSSGTILIVSAIISLVIVSMIHFFILVPLAKSEESTARSIIAFVGKEGEVITTIPTDGLGEILITSTLGLSGHVSRSTTNSRIGEGAIVTVIEIDHDGILLVEELENKKA